MRLRRVMTALATVGVLVVAGCSDTTGTPTRSDSPTVSAVPTALILDASGSMTTADAPGPRIGAAKAAAVELVESLPSETRLALLAYGTGTGSEPAERDAGCRDIVVLRPLQPVDVGGARAAIDAVVPRGFTPIADALARAAETLPASGPSAVVLVSDGEDTCGKPPCAVAGELKRQRPDLQISTVGFRTDAVASGELRCIAEATGGLFVTADNAAQLSRRLIATRTDASKIAIIDDSYLGIRLGESLADVRARHDDFPTSGTAEGSRTVYHWRDCDWVVGEDSTIVEIRPRSSDTRTVDGIGAGSTVAEAKEFYGDPTSDTPNADGSRTLVFGAGGGSGGVGYRMVVRGDGDSGVIDSLVICGCAVRTADPCTGVAGRCVRVADADVDGDGAPDAIGVSVLTSVLPEAPGDEVIVGQAEVEVLVAFESEVKSVVFRVSGAFFLDPNSVYVGSFGLSRATGADIVVYLVHAQGPPDSFGVVGWKNGELLAVPSPFEIGGSLDRAHWWMGEAERKRTSVRCGTAPEIDAEVLSLPPGYNGDGSVQTTTTYRFDSGRWVEKSVDTGVGPELYGRGSEQWNAGKDAFVCRDLGVRRG